MVEVGVGRLDTVLQIRVLLVVSNAWSTLFVDGGDCRDSDVCTTSHHLGLGHRQQVVGVLKLVLVEQTLLSTSELAFGNQIKVLGERVLPVVQVTRTNTVQVLQLLVNEGLQALHCVELLPIVLQVVVALVVRLFELDELVPFLGHLVVVAEAHVQLLVLDTLALLGKHGVHVLLELLSVLCLEDLHARQSRQPLLLTVNKEVPRLLQSQRVVTLSVVDFIQQVLVDQLVPCE